MMSRTVNQLLNGLGNEDGMERRAGMIGKMEMKVRDGLRNGRRAVDRSGRCSLDRTIKEFTGGQDQRVGVRSSEGVESTVTLFM